MRLPRLPDGKSLPFSSDITPESIYRARRSFVANAALLGSSAALVGLPSRALAVDAQPAPLAAKPNPAYRLPERQTAWTDATTYNNFYEFGTDKADPSRNAGTLRPRPWTLTIGGAVEKPLRLDLDALLKLAPMEERVYRLRCVEGWSMVIPWSGYSLAELLRKARPLGKAKYVEFVSLADREQMPGLASRVLEWPYTEGLRLDEAMHPLALLAFGMYGKQLPNQNGAPLRLVVPWKYGFKSAKSIVAINLLDQPPVTSWNRSAPQEYGFYSNVNPGVDHPRWSQATERRIGEDGFFTRKRATLMFNGYDQVATLYSGMDLKRFF